MSLFRHYQYYLFFISRLYVNNRFLSRSLPGIKNSKNANPIGPENSAFHIPFFTPHGLYNIAQ